MNKELLKFKKEIRMAIADYMQSEGCSCCRNITEHAINEKRIAKLLGVPSYADASGYDFSKFKSKKNEIQK